MKTVQQKFRLRSRVLHFTPSAVYAYLKIFLTLAFVWSIGATVSFWKTGSLQFKNPTYVLSHRKANTLKPLGAVKQPDVSFYTGFAQKSTDATALERKTFANTSNKASGSKVTIHKEKLETEERSSDLMSTDLQECLLWEQHDEQEDEDVQPQFKLDPTKFLYPGLIWGPNNQIVGFWQSIYLALRLNRTLVVPYFHAHYTVGRGKIPASQRIDLQRVRRFVSVISIESFRQSCNASFDVVLQAQITNSKTLKDFERDTEMKILQIDGARVTEEKGSTQLRLIEKEQEQNEIPNIPAYPPDNYQITYEPWLTGEPGTLRKAYNTSARCALYSAPFYTINVTATKGIAEPLPSRQNLSFNATDGELYSAVLDSVRRPAAIVKAVERYKAEVLGNEPYVAVHWRYDFEEWGGKRCRPDNPTTFSKMCEELRKITPEDVATGILTSLNEAKINQSAWKHVYIATPPTLRNFSDQIVKVLQRLNKNVQSSKKPLDVFLIERYEPCWKRGEWLNENEIFSLAEMEVLAQSEWFFFSRVSTFSTNVQPLRLEKEENEKFRRKFEKSLYNISRKAMLKRSTTTDK